MTLLFDTTGITRQFGFSSHESSLQVRTPLGLNGRVSLGSQAQATPSRTERTAAVFTVVVSREMSTTPFTPETHGNIEDVHTLPGRLQSYPRSLHPSQLAAYALHLPVYAAPISIRTPTRYLVILCPRSAA